MSTTTPEAPARARLDRPTIAAAGLRLLRRGESLSMRNLAEELLVSTMAAYRHVGGRKDLGALLVNEVFEEAFIVLPGAHEGLATLVAEAADALREYPGLVDDFHGPALDQPEVAVWLGEVRSRMPDGAPIEPVLWLVRGLVADPAAADDAALMARALERR